MNLKINFKCPSCGGKDFVSTGEHELKPTDTCRCTHCGHTLQAAEALDIQKKLLQDALAASFGNAFKPTP